jgi:MFS family permease
MTTAPVAAELRESRLRAFVRGLDPRLPRSVWTIQAGLLANSFGTGMLMPFVLIYLHDVRGFSLATAGLVAGTFGAVAMVATPVAGSLLDRRSPRTIFVVSLLLLAAGYALFPLASAPWQAFLLMGVAGLGNGGLWPSQSVLLIALVPQDRRHAAFSLNRMASNLGLGAGALTGGLVASTGSPGSFRLLFLLNAATFVLFAASALLVREPERAAPRSTGRSGSYRDVLRDRTFLAFMALNSTFVALGYAQLEAGLPVFAKHQGGVSESTIGLVFLANVVSVVLIQLPVSRLVEGRRRMRMLALMSTVWAAALLLVDAAGLGGPAGLAAVVLAVAGVVFGAGECLHGSITAPLAADLAPEELRGRYMAMSTNSFAIGFAAGPALAGAVLGLAPFALFPLAALGCLVAGALSLALESRLPAAVRVTGAA